MEKVVGSAVPELSYILAQSSLAPSGVNPDDLTWLLVSSISSSDIFFF